MRDMMDSSYLLLCIFDTVCSAVIDADLEHMLTDEFGQSTIVSEQGTMQGSDADGDGA